MSPLILGDGSRTTGVFVAGSPCAPSPHNESLSRYKARAELLSARMRNESAVEEM